MIAGIADGTIDVIVSSHDPQDVDTKRQPFAEAADGAVGLETMLPAALRLFHSGDIDLVTLFRALATRPAEILGLEVGRLAPGAPADLILVDPDVPWVLDADTLRSKSKNTPFDGRALLGPGAADDGRRADGVRGRRVAGYDIRGSRSRRNCRPRARGPSTAWRTGPAPRRPTRRHRRRARRSSCRR